MTNQEKDLRNAREYLEEYYPELQEELFHVYSSSSKSPKYTIDEMLASHVQWLEQKGVIKFTENRFKPTECVRCGKELWLKDSDAGTDKELLRICDNCIDQFTDLTP